MVPTNRQRPGSLVAGLALDPVLVIAKNGWPFGKTLYRLPAASRPALRLGQHGLLSRLPLGRARVGVDQEGNLYVAEVDAGRIQKFTPRAGASPAFLPAKPVYSAWQQ
jgi:hypothetical protein